MNVCMYVCRDRSVRYDRQRDIEMVSPGQEGGRFGIYGSRLEEGSRSV